MTSNVPPQIGDPVLVEWYDSTSRGRWEKRKEIEEWIDRGIALHESCGFLLRMDDRLVAICQSRVEWDDDSEPMVAEVQLIPRKCVWTIGKLS